MESLKSLSQASEINSICDEVRELLQTLPKQSAWGDDLYQYQGIWFNRSGVEEVVFSQSHFQARDTDVFLVTQPKAGTTWLKSLVFAITQRDQYPTSDPNHPLYSSLSHALILSFETIYMHNNNPNLDHIPSPRLFATHAPYPLLPDSVKNNTSCKLIYLCRDPKDVFVSAWFHVSKLGGHGVFPLNETFDLFCKGIFPSGPVWDHTLGYWNLSLKQAPQKVLFLTYEDLKQDTAAQVRKIAMFLGCPFSSAEEEDCVAQEIAKMCSFENLSNLDVNKNGITLTEENKNFFRKGEVGDWVNYLTPSMAKKLDDVINEKLLGSGFSFT